MLTLADRGGRGGGVCTLPNLADIIGEQPLIIHDRGSVYEREESQNEKFAFCDTSL